MKRENVSVVFTGQVRDRALFERSLAELRELACVKDFILATWHGDALAGSDYLAALERGYGLRVVTVADPALDFDLFNGVRQSTTLRRGLQAAEGAEYVLKTRPDCHIAADAVRHLAEVDRAITDPAAVRLRVFEEKVSVNTASAYVPLYMDDKVLFGRRADLLRLGAIDLNALRCQISPKWGHYSRFYPPFVDDFPLFRPFLRHENLLSSLPAALAARLLAKACGAPEFAATLLVYYRLVAGLFCLDWDGHLVELRGSRMAPFDGRGPLPMQTDVQCNSNAFFRDAARGRVDQPVLGPALAAAAADAHCVADLRDLGAGMDFGAFWAGLRQEARAAIGFDAVLAEAKGLLARGAIAECFDVLQGLVKFDPFHPEVHYLIGMLYALAGNWKMAGHFLRGSLEYGARYDSAAGRMLDRVEAGDAAGVRAVATGAA